MTIRIRDCARADPSTLAYAETLVIPAAVGRYDVSRPVEHRPASCAQSCGDGRPVHRGRRARHVTAALVDTAAWRTVDGQPAPDAAAQRRHRRRDRRHAGDRRRATRRRSAASTLGVAMPGPFDYDTGIGRFHDVGKFDALNGVDVGAALRPRRPGLPPAIAFVNDAAAFAIGEWIGRRRRAGPSGSSASRSAPASARRSWTTADRSISAAGRAAARVRAPAAHRRPAARGRGRTGAPSSRPTGRRPRLPPDRPAWRPTARSRRSRAAGDEAASTERHRPRHRRAGRGAAPPGWPASAPRSLSSAAASTASWDSSSPRCATVFSAPSRLRRGPPRRGGSSSVRATRRGSTLAGGRLARDEPAPPTCPSSRSA